MKKHNFTKILFSLLCIIFAFTFLSCQNLFQEILNGLESSLENGGKLVSAEGTGKSSSGIQISVSIAGDTSSKNGLKSRTVLPSAYNYRDYTYQFIATLNEEEKVNGTFAYNELSPIELSSAGTYNFTLKALKNSKVALEGSLSNVEISEGSNSVQFALSVPTSGDNIAPGCIEFTLNYEEAKSALTSANCTLTSVGVSLFNFPSGSERATDDGSWTITYKNSDTDSTVQESTSAIFTLSESANLQAGTYKLKISFTVQNSQSTSNQTSYFSLVKVVPALTSTGNATIQNFNQFQDIIFENMDDGTGGNYWKNGSVVAISVATACTENLPTSSDVSRTGYTFGGWYTDSSCEQNLVTTTQSAVTTYYAKWTANTYTVSFNANAENDVTGSMEAQDFTYDEDKKALTTNDFTREKYQFTGWNTQSDGTGTSYEDGAEVCNLTDVAGGAITLYAQWVFLPIALSNGGGTNKTRYASISDAESYIIGNGSNSDSWIIYVDGEKGAVQGTNTLSASITTEKASSITICGFTDNAQTISDLTSYSYTDILNGNSAGTVLTINTAVPVTIQKIKITGGNAEIGGGVNVASSANVTIADGAYITSNVAESCGGGVFSKGTLSMSAGVISSNTAGNNENVGYGGGICVDEGSFTMSGGTISANNSSETGGGVITFGTFNMSNGTISENTALYGGGVYIAETVNITVYVDDKNAGSTNNGSGSLTMTGGTISSNSAIYESNDEDSYGGLGGGVYNEGNFALSGGTITGNTASDAGNGIYNTRAYNDASACFSVSGAATVDSSNDVYLYISEGESVIYGSIKLAGSLSSASVATITPSCYDAGTQILALAENAGTTIADNYSKFTIADADSHGVNLADTGNLAYSVGAAVLFPTASDFNGDGEWEQTCSVVYGSETITNEESSLNGQSTIATITISSGISTADNDDLKVCRHSLSEWGLTEDDGYDSVFVMKIDLSGFSGLEDSTSVQISGNATEYTFSSIKDGDYYFYLVLGVPENTNYFYVQVDTTKFIYKIEME